jgi:predicted ATPase/DNA-binding CsgD family transcriptional regulator
MPESKLFIVPKEPASPGSKSSRVPNNLPASLRPEGVNSATTRLVGRDEEVQALRLLLAELTPSGPRVSLVTLVGPGGVGKTSLALRVAEQALEEPLDGVYFVALDSVSDPGLVIPAIATTLQVREVPGTALSTTLQAHLQGKQMLLVLDNFEQILDAGPAVAELTAACPGVKMLVTSRAALGLRAEREFAVSPLPVPGGATLGSDPSAADLARYGAVQLFVQRAATPEADFELTDDNAADVVEICRRVDGLPLAIELVAAHARLLSPKSILAHMASATPLRLLAGRPRDAATRHRTMRDTIEWSYNLLDAGEQQLFRRLSVFAGGFAVPAAQEVASPGVGDRGYEHQRGAVGARSEAPTPIDVLEGIEALVEHNLVRRVERKASGDWHLGMLETVREYAWEKLRESGEDEAARRRHADYYLALAREAGPGLDGPDAPAWLDRLKREEANLRAALGVLLGQKEAGAAEDALRLLMSVWGFWDGRTHSSELQTWLDAALQRAGDKPGPLLAQGLRMRSYLAGRQGDYLQARLWGERAVEVARRSGDKSSIGQGLNSLGGMAIMQGDLEAGHALLEEALVEFREAGDHDRVATVLNNLGELARYQGNYERAERYYRECLGIFRAIGERVGTMLALENLGTSFYHQGRLQEASASLLESLALAQEMESPMRVASALVTLCGVTLAETDRSGTWDPRAVEHAVRLAGLSAALLERIGRQLEPPDQAELDRNLDRARQMLGMSDPQGTVGTRREKQNGGRAFARAWEEGRAMTLDQAVQLAGREYGYEDEGAGPGRTAGAPGRLTPREREVAGLVTRGMSNAEIARSLVLSERTVEMHVSNALHKLGFATRHQLATWALEQGLGASAPGQGTPPDG